MGTSSAWTPERKARQAEAIRRWQPWNKSTGPKTEDGKARSSQNAFKYSSRSAVRAIGRHSQIAQRILRLEIKQEGRKPFGSDEEPAKPVSLTRAEQQELASLYKQLKHFSKEMMDEIVTDKSVDLNDLHCQFYWGSTKI